MSFMFQGQWAGPVPRHGVPGARARSNGIGVPIRTGHPLRQKLIEALCDADLRARFGEVRRSARQTLVSSIRSCTR